ncbi:MAG: hypothetical protein U0694_08895 [Anaerolineae bacterium]
MTIESVLRQYEAQLMALPNVVGVGIGEKAGRRVITVFVRRKLPEAELQPSEIVPNRLEEYETDVEEIGPVSSQSPSVS